MVQFTVHGPFDIPTYRGRVGRIVRAEEGRSFFRAHPTWAARRGCYVFAMRAGGGVTPTYVGRATKTFDQECFTADKLGRCNQTLVDYERGTLVMYLLAAPTGRGRPPEKQIKLLEDFLIQVGVAANDELLNVKGTKQEQWALTGVVRGAQGRPSSAASSFKAAMKLGAR